MKTPIRIVLFTLTVSLFSASNPFVGVWKLNSTQSKFTDVRGPFFATMQIESAGAGLKLTASTVDGEGIASDFTSTCALDGAACKVIPASSLRSVSAVDTIKLKAVGANTILATGTRNGKPVYSDRWVVSPDGQTMTIVRGGTTPDGKKYNSTMLLERSPQ